MKQRNLTYEEKFRAYLYGFDFETHRKICKNINVNCKTLKQEDILINTSEEELFCLIGSFLNRLKPEDWAIATTKKGIRLNDKRDRIIITDQKRIEIIKQMVKDFN